MRKLFTILMVLFHGFASIMAFEPVDAILIPVDKAEVLLGLN